MDPIEIEDYLAYLNRQKTVTERIPAASDPQTIEWEDISGWIPPRGKKEIPWTF